MTNIISFIAIISERICRPKKADIMTGLTNIYNRGENCEREEKNQLLRSHFSMALRAPGDLEKLQRGRTKQPLSALQNEPTEQNPLFNLSSGVTLQSRGPLCSSVALCLSFLCFIETDRESESEGGGRVNRGQAVVTQIHFTVNWENPGVRVCLLHYTVSREIFLRMSGELL